MESCVWLEKHLAEYPAILVLVSHSEDFLNGVCTNIIHLTSKRKFVYYSGNYDRYLPTYASADLCKRKAYRPIIGSMRQRFKSAWKQTMIVFVSSMRMNS